MVEQATTRFNVDWSDAQRNTEQFLRQVDQEAQRLLARASQSGGPDDFRALGREFAQVEQRLRAMGLQAEHFSRVLRAIQGTSLQARDIGGVGTAFVSREQARTALLGPTGATPANIEALQQGLGRGQAAAARAAEATAATQASVNEEMQNALRNARAAASELAEIVAHLRDNASTEAEISSAAEQRLERLRMSQAIEHEKALASVRERAAIQELAETHGRQVSLVRERIDLETRALTLDLGEPGRVRQRVQAQEDLRRITEERRDLENRALQQVRMQYATSGHAAMASRVGTAALHTVPVGTGLMGPMQLASLNQHLQRTLAQQAAQQAAAQQAAAAAAPGQMTLFQRLYGGMMGGTGTPPTLGRFIGTRFTSTAAYGLSGAALYGTMRFMREMITEASNLQVEFSILEAQFENSNVLIGSMAGGFAEVRQEIMNISNETLTQADIVTSVTRQLAGAFSQDGAADFSVMDGAVQTALQLARVTSLTEQQVTDDLTAIALAFRRTLEDGQLEPISETFDRVSDELVGVEQGFGVLAGPLADFAANLAPLAQELGFTSQQLIEFGAIAQQASGVTGTALAEQAGRWLSALQQRQGEIIALLAESDAAGFVGDLSAAFAEGDIPQVLISLTEAAEELSRTERNALTSLVGDQRQAAAFAGVLQRGQALRSALGTEDDYSGALESRFEKFTETITGAALQFERMVEKIGIAIVEAGLGDALINLAQAGSMVAEVLMTLGGILGEFNSILFGIPAQIALVAAAFAGLNLVTRAFRSSALIAALTGGPGGGGASLLGRQLSPMAASGGLRRGLANPSFLFRGAATATGGSALLAGATATLAPIAAAWATSELVSTYRRVGSEVQQARSSVEEAVRQALSEGANPEDILREFGGADNFATRATSALGMGPTVRETIERAIGSWDFDTSFGRQAEETLSALQDGLYQELENLDLSEFTDDRRFQGPNNEVLDVLMSGLEDYIDSAGNVSRDHQNYIQEALRILTEASPEIMSEINDAVAESLVMAENLATIEDLAGNEDTQGRIARIQALVESGEAAPTDLIEPMNRLQEALSAAIDAQLETGEGVAEELQNHANTVMEARREIENAIADFLARPYEMLARMEAIAGGGVADTGPQSMEALRLRLNSLTDDSARTEVAFEIFELQQEIFQDYVDSAETAAEQLARAQQGFELDTGALVALRRAALMTPGSDTREHIQRMSDISGDSIEEVADAVARSISDFGDGAFLIMREVAAQAVRVRAAAVREAIRALQMSRSVYGRIIGLVGVARSVAEYGQAMRDFMSFNADMSTPFDNFRGGVDTGTYQQRAADEAERAADDARRGAEEAQRRADEARQEWIAQQNALLDIEVARADGDPVRIAQLAQQRARFAQQVATTESERLAAVAEYIEATNQLNDAMQEVTEAQRDLHVAVNRDSPVAAAQAELANARDAVNQASGAAARARAMAERIRAERSLANALQDMWEAQQEVLIATAEATGNGVEVARLQLNILRDRWRDRNALGLNDIERQQLQADIIRGEASLRDAELDYRRGTINYQMEIGQITRQQAVSALQALLQIPNLTEQQIRDINLEIMRLRDQLGADFQYNLPTQLALPAPYEIRRMGTAQAAGVGYQDNREINVVIHANTNADPQAIAAAVEQVVGQPNRYGLGVRRF